MTFYLNKMCFSRPDLVGKPVAVAHARGNREASATKVALRKAEMKAHMNRRKKEASKTDDDGEIQGDAEESSSTSLCADDFVEFSSMSELASVSYEARAAGVKNGTFLGAARKLCPDLVTIPYDFDGYQEVARVLYDTVASITLDIQAVSCDEMLADITDVVNSLRVEPMHVAEFLREQIFSKTQCKASVGLGSSILLARVATRRAKPDGKYHLADDQAEEFIRGVGVGELPGVGRVNARRLKELKVEKCQDMQALSMVQLQKEFGAKVGKSLYGFCRGIDERKINLRQERKSVSAEVNYGIRFRCETDFADFLDRLSAEVAERLENAGCVGGGRCVTLKLMVRAKDAPEETSKFLGHGVCDSVSRSCTLSSATREAKVIAREAKLLGNAMNVKCQDLRGIGIQLSKLEFSRSDGAASKSILSYVRKKAEGSSKSKTSSVNRTEGHSRSNNPDCDITFSQIDPEVLTALPAEVRAEVEATYRKREKASESEESGQARRDSILDATISQLDQEYISALPSDMAEEVKQQLAENKRVRESAAGPSTSSNAFAAIMSKTPTKELTPKRGKKRGRPPKNSPRFIKSSAKTSAKASRELFKEKDAPANTETCQEPEDVTVVEDIKIKDEESEVNLDGETELEGVRLLVRNWMRSCPSGPTADDLSAVSDYFAGVVRQKTRLSQVPVLLKMMSRTSAQLGAAWTDAVAEISVAVQDCMIQVFGHKLHV